MCQGIGSRDVVVPAQETHLVVGCGHKMIVLWWEFVCLFLQVPVFFVLNAYLVDYIYQNVHVWGVWWC